MRISVSTGNLWSRSSVCFDIRYKSSATVGAPVCSSVRCLTGDWDSFWGWSERVYHHVWYLTASPRTLHVAFQVVLVCSSLTSVQMVEFSHNAIVPYYIKMQVLPALLSSFLDWLIASYTNNAALLCDLLAESSFPQSTKVVGSPLKIFREYLILPIFSDRSYYYSF